MMLLLYFRNGINIIDVIKIMESNYNFELDLESSLEIVDGDTEYTRRCYGRATFPELTSPLHVRLYAVSLRSEDEIYLRPRWNPNMDTKIHKLGIKPIDYMNYSIYPVRYVNWSVAMKYAPSLYLIYKKLFLLFRCDEAQVLIDYEDILIHWVRASNYQVVIDKYESGAEMTLQQCDECRWSKIRRTEEVFPELANEYDSR